MSLLEMSLTGGIFILAVVVLRALALNRLPKGTFLALWAAAVARLLIPFDIPSPASVYTLAGELTPRIPADLPGGTVPVFSVVPDTPAAVYAAPAVPTEAGMDFPVWTAVWLAGLALCAGAFALAYFRHLREFRASLPVEEESVRRWLAGHPLRRTLSVRQSDRIAGPLTYGIFRPVILLPHSTDWSEKNRLRWVLEHELVHIQRLDAAGKLVLAAAACVHWFNPLAWVMVVLANRDMELRCDELVVRRLGLDKKSAYARTLIDLEAERSGLDPFASAFSKNAIEERITAIMKLKKFSLAALLAAVLLVCGVTAACATSAAEPEPEDLRSYLTALPGGDFTQAESRKLFALWIDGYEEMTIADFRGKMIGGRTDEDMVFIERFSLSEAAYALSAGKEAEALSAFNDYFFNVYEPLTADAWQNRSFDGPGANGTEYMYILNIQDPEKVTVGQYEKLRREVETALRQPMAEMSDALKVEDLSIPFLKVELGYYITSFDGGSDDPDAALHAFSSQQTAAEWDRLLSPYTAFGLTYEFDDPDLDGNGLTMWFNGKEVRGIMDEQEGVWITEHTGNTTYAPGAVELYVVYSGGKMTGLREATAEEQAAFTGDRTANSNRLNSQGEEQREFPQATAEDYASFLTLRTENYQDLPLADFNARLLDWANANSDAYDRINCDVLWDDYGVELDLLDKQFVAHTCRLSGTENGQMIRGLYTGQEADPGFAANLPMRDQKIDGVTAAWCDLYYDISYHISDKSACTVGERDACVGEMKNAVAAFWQDTELDALLAMSEEDVVKQFNTWASLCGTEHVSFHHITGDHIHYEHADERHIYDESLQGAAGHHPEPHRTSHHG